MARTIRDSVLIQSQMQESLKEAGIDNRAALDKLMSTRSIEQILSDAPAVYHYFKLANKGMWAVVEPKDDREVRGATPTPDHYREYFDNQISQPTPYFNVIPAEDLFNPEALGANAGLNKQQVYAYQMLLTPPPETVAPTWSEVQSQGSYSGGNYGGGGGKALSTGHPAGNPGTKNLTAPPAPGGGTGAGGFPPPPSGGGYPPGAFPPGGTGDYNSYNYDATASTRQGREYVNANFSNDASYGWFNMLFDRQDWATGVYMSGVSQLDQIRKLKQEISTAMANGDPRQVASLSYQMQGLNSQEQEITDKMMRAQHVHDEFVSLVKGMLDVMGKASDAIVRNMRQ